MTLTAEQSSNKEAFESLSLKDLIKYLRFSMSQGCIRPSHVYDLVDEALDRLDKISQIVKPIDFSKAAPLPWTTEIGLSAIGDTGDYDSWCHLNDATGERIVGKSGDGPDYRNVEKEDGDHDADLLAMAESANAVSKIKELLKCTES